MRVLIDSNVLLRALHPSHPQYRSAERSIATLRLRGETLCIAPQVLIEFWAVATRPREDNGFGLTPARVEGELLQLRRLFQLLPSTPDVLDVWQQLVVKMGVVWKQTHDAHLVAIMRMYSVVDILTFNVRHFARFAGINVLDPAQDFAL